MDFGIARSSAAGDPAAKPGVKPSREALASGLTMAGAIVGTLEYMAPEQFRGEAVDHRADIYAFGLILYDLLTGRRRKGGARTAFEEAARREKKALPPLAEVRPDVPAPLERIVTRCIQTDPAARYATTEELAADLDRLDEHGQLRPLPKRFPKGFLVAASAVILAALVGTWQLARSRVPADAAAADVGAGGGLRQPDGGSRVRRLGRAGLDGLHRRSVVHLHLPAGRCAAPGVPARQERQAGRDRGAARLAARRHQGRPRRRDRAGRVRLRRVGARDRPGRRGGGRQAPRRRHREGERQERRASRRSPAWPAA